jgi:hypothetical protein
MESLGLLSFKSGEKSDQGPTASGGRASRPIKKKQAASRRAAAPPPKPSRKRTSPPLLDARKADGQRSDFTRDC